MLVVYGIFRTSYVQTKLAGVATRYLSKELGTQVSIQSLDISFLFNIVLTGVSVKDLHNTYLLKAEKIKFNIGKLNFKRRYLGIYTFSLQQAEVNLILYRSDSVMNYKFIADYFTGNDTITKDVTKKPWNVGFSGIKFSNTTFRYHNQLTDSVATGVDYNNIYISNLNLEINRLAFSSDSISANIKNLQFDEKSGFILSSLTAQIQVKNDSIVARNLQIITPESHINMNLKFLHNNYSAYNNFIDSVKISGNFDQSAIMLSDIGYFAPELAQTKELLKIHGPVKGTIASLRARQLRLALGKNTYFEGDISMDGLPNINETFIHLNIKDFKTNYQDIKAFRINEKQSIEIPDLVKNLGNIRIKGYFTGFIYDFVSAATFTTASGTLQTDISLKTDSKNKINFRGHANINNWDLGKIFEVKKYLGKIDFDSELSGSYHKKEGISALLDGVVKKLELMGNEFNNIKIDGAMENKLFNGTLVLRDELIDLDFNGLVDFSSEIPAFNFKSTVKDAYLSKLNLWERDSTSKLSTAMDLNFKGSNIDNLLGSLRFSNTLYSEEGVNYPAKNIELTTRTTSENSKALSLESDFADINFTGRFTFIDFYSSLMNILNAYLPSLRPAPAIELYVEQEHIFEYTINIKDVNALTELFLPSLKVNSTAYLFGSYNSVNETVLINGQADQFEYQGIKINNWFVRGQNSGNSLQITTGSSSVVFSESSKENALELGLDNFSFDVSMRGDSVKYLINWKDEITGKRNFGDFAGILSFSERPYIKATLNKGDFAVNDTTFVVEQIGDFIIDSSSVYINSFRINGVHQDLQIDGKISTNPADMLYLRFKDLNISNADLLLAQENLDFDGIVNGYISLNDVYGARKIQADIKVDDFSFNKDRLGDAVILTRWDDEKSGLEINADVIYTGNIGSHKPISVKGYIFPERSSDKNFDLDIGLTNYNLTSLNPFLEGFASSLKGYTSGTLRLDGTFAEPAFTGSLQLMRTQMKIDYLNVIYSFADKVEITPGLISAKNIMIYDSLGNTGLCDFSLTHNYFRDMVMNLNVQASNLSGLHTTFRHNELFYGNAVASGNVSIRGPFSDLRMNIRARSEKGTNMFIPINLDVDATENAYIRFTKKNGNEEEITYFEPVTSGVNLDMIIDVTKDAGIQIFLPENIGNIKATGSGQIQMGIDTRGDITIFGDYNIEGGTFLFTFQNIINRVFSIERGSVISFTGSPYDANMNVKAVYKIRASLNGIPELAAMPEYAGRNIPVDCIIHLKNNLYNPDIAFSLRLPDAEEQLKNLVFSAIDTTNEAVMTQQMVSLLLLKSFSFTGNASLAGSVGSSSLEMLTSQLSSMLSQISKDIDIGLNYRTADALTSEAIEVALSTHLFNDRVTIDGNFGIINSGSTQNTSNIVGDVVVDVKITRDGRFRVKAYNKTNNPFEVTSYNANYKQGVGIYYRYEFDRFSEIFQRQRKKTVPLTTE